MNAFAPYLAAIHLQDLLQDAEIARRAKLASASQPGIPAQRRGLGGLFTGGSIARSDDRRPVRPGSWRSRHGRLAGQPIEVRSRIVRRHDDN